MTIETLSHFIAACWLGASQALAEVPKEVWAAVIAAGIAAYTTKRSNENARLMLGTQLGDASKQAEDKRKMDLRRDVFLPAVKAVADVNSVISNLLDVTVPNQLINETYTRAVADIAGVHVVASPETLSAVIELTQYASELYLDFSLCRAKLVIENQKLAALASIVTREIQSGAALLELMKNHNLAGGKHEQWVPIQRQWDIHQQILAEHQSKQAEQQRTLLNMSSAMLENFGSRIVHLFPLQARALVAVRHELGLPLDESEYEKFAERFKQAAEQSIRKGVQFLADAPAK